MKNTFQNNSICENCGHKYYDHFDVDDGCPPYGNSSFRAETNDAMTIVLQAARIEKLESALKEINLLAPERALNSYEMQKIAREALKETE